MTHDKLTSLEDREFDVVIIGGGIVGASTAREAAAAGYSVLIVEKGDFASGTSSRSSRLMHCGLRYFEAPHPIRYFLRHPGRFFTSMRMAKAGMRERREHALTSGPRVRPLDFYFPIYRDGEYAPWQVDAAFSILKRLAPGDVPLDYKRLAKKDAVKIPMVAALGRRDDMHSAAKFTEYQFNWPERLCIDAVLDAQQAGAVALNYTQADLGEAGQGSRKIRLRDNAGNQAQVSGKRVMVMAGIWIDEILGKTESAPTRKVFGTKGAHILFRLPPEYRKQGITTVNSVGEPFYCIPWGDLHYIGPTETPYDGDPDNIHASAEDLEFILHETDRLFPGLGVTRDKIIKTWAGVRPLSYDPAHPKGNRSRLLHDLASEGLQGVFAMTAGPIMSHRDAGREVVTRLRQDMQPSNAPRPQTYAPRLPLENSNTAPLIEGSDYRLADIRVAVQQEQARTLMDVLYRRSGIGHQHNFSAEEIERAAGVMAEELGWTEAEMKAEIDRYKTLTARLFTVPGTMPEKHA